MELYTKEQLLDICQSVAEKACANSLPAEWVKENCEYYGWTKLHTDITKSMQSDIDDDNIEKIELILKH